MPTKTYRETLEHYCKMLDEVSGDHSGTAIFYEALAKELESLKDNVREGYGD